MPLHATVVSGYDDGGGLESQIVTATATVDLSVHNDWQEDKLLPKVRAHNVWENIDALLHTRSVWLDQQHQPLIRNKSKTTTTRSKRKSKIKATGHLKKRNVLNIWQEKPLLTRHSAFGGSLMKAVREYYTVFQDGLGRGESRAIGFTEAYKLNFLRQIMDPLVNVNSVEGVDRLIEQWRRYTLCHDRFMIDLSGSVPTVCGSVENPIVAIQTNLHVRFSRRSIAYLFPFVVYKEALTQKLIDHELTYHCLTRFTFTKEGTIRSFVIDFDFIRAFGEVLGNIADVAELLDASIIDDNNLLAEPMEIHVLPDDRSRSRSSDSQSENADAAAVVTIMANEEMATNDLLEANKMNLGYLLSNEDDTI